MESNLPTRPTSDLRFRLKGRNRPPAAIQIQHHAWPGPGLRHHNRSSSLSSITHSLSQLLPKNRKERGGTVRQIEDDGGQRIDTLPAVIGVVETPPRSGQYDEIDSDMEVTRRTQSESPKKIPRTPNGESNSPSSTSRLRKLGGWKRFWEMHNTARDDGNIDVLLHPATLKIEDEDIEYRVQPREDIELATASDIAKQLASHIPISPTALERSPSTSLQMYKDKRARREQRRSFRRSDDFLGVQGANPRTGFPDHSTATSSSTGDVISEPTQHKLEEDGRVMESARREYQAALERREREMRRLEMERERRRRDKKERAEKKRVELRARMRREGRWRSEGNQWKMVTEPMLSPIVQSTVGSPTRENPTVQRPKVPSGVDRKPTPGILTPKKNDYFSPAGLPATVPRRFHRHNLGPAQTSSLPMRYKLPDVHSAPSTPQSSKLQSPHGESTSSNPSKPQVPVNAGRPTSNKTSQSETVRQGALPISPKEVGFHARARRASSADTIIYTAINSAADLVELPGTSKAAPSPPQPLMTPRVNVMTPGETTHMISWGSPNVIEETFLDMDPYPTLPKELPRNEVIAILFPSHSMSQVPNPCPYFQSPVDMFQANRIVSLDELPPVVLKDPSAAAIPSDYPKQRLPSPELMKPPPSGPPSPMLHSQPSTIITPIITTIGLDSLPPLQNLTDSNNVKDVQESILQTNPSSSTAPILDYRLKEKSNGMQNKTFPTSIAGTVTSLEIPISTTSTPTKCPVPRLCQPASLNVGKDVPKSILTSTSMSPQQSPSQRPATGQKTARVAFLTASPQKLGSAVRARSISLISPKLRTETRRESRDRDRKIFSGGDEGTGNLFQSRDELKENSELLRTRITQSITAGGSSRNDREEGFVVWSTETESRVGNRPPSLTREKALPPIGGKKPAADTDENIAKVSFLEKAFGIAKEMVQTAWWFVSPVFNSRSGLRWRWVRNELTWQDIFLIGAAGIFGGGAFLIVVLCARILGVGLQIVRMFVVICKFLVGP